MVPAPKMATGEPVFEARGATNVYHVGEVEVDALRGVDVDFYEGESRSCSVRPVTANRHISSDKIRDGASVWEWRDR